MIGLYLVHFLSDSDDIGIIRKPRFEPVYSIPTLCIAGLFCFKKTPYIADLLGQLIIVYNVITSVAAALAGDFWILGNKIAKNMKIVVEVDEIRS
jgi:hypothetical protein